MKTKSKHKFHWCSVTKTKSQLFSLLIWLAVITLSQLHGWVVTDHSWLPKLEIALTKNKNRAILDYIWHSKWKLLYQQFAGQHLVYFNCLLAWAKIIWASNWIYCTTLFSLKVEPCDFTNNAHQVFVKHTSNIRLLFLPLTVYSSLKDINFLSLFTPSIPFPILSCLLV